MKRFLCVLLCTCTPVLATAMNPESAPQDSVWRPDCKAAAQFVYASCLVAPRQPSGILTRDQAMKANVHNCELFAQFNYSECVHPSPVVTGKP